MPTKRKNLDTMPQVVMERILKDCDLMDILCLRKTCSHTRSLVDLIKPDPQIKRIIFTCTPETVSMILTLTDSRWRKVTYENRERGWSSLFTNATAAEKFRQDFKALFTMLSRQKAPIEECDWVIFENSMPVFRESMARLLAESSTQLRIEHLTLTFHGDLDLMSVLPLVCANSLRKLDVENKKRESEVLDLSRVAQLDQWKSLQKLKLSGCRLGVADSRTYSALLAEPVRRVAIVREMPDHEFIIPQVILDRHQRIIRQFIHDHPRIAWQFMND